MNVSKRNQRKKVGAKYDYTIIALMGFTIAFFSFFAIRPSVTLIVSLLKERSEYERVNMVLESKIQQIIAMQTNYMNILGKKHYIDEMIPNNNQLGQTKELLDTPLSLTNFTIKEVLLHPVIKRDLSTIPILLSGFGTYSDIRSFIDKSYYSKRLYFLKNVDLEKDENGSKSATLNLRATVEAYYFGN